MPTEPKARVAAPREYVVLVLGVSTPQESWYDVGRANATTAKQAIAKIVDDLPADEQNGTFVAVPARNWQPVTRSTETVVKATWS